MTFLRLGDHKRKVGSDKWLLLIDDDVHFDSAKCDRKLFKKHLEQAREKGADIFSEGIFLGHDGWKI